MGLPVETDGVARHSTTGLHSSSPGEDGHRSALALLAPRKESANPLEYRGFQTDSDGSFEFEGLAAGDYVVIVLEDWFDFEYSNPVAVRPYLETGRAMHLDGGERQKIHLELN